MSLMGDFFIPFISYWCYALLTVSESMAAFLTAEQLAQHSMSESQIQNAMDQAQRNQQFIVANKPTQKSQLLPSFVCNY